MDKPSRRAAPASRAGRHGIISEILARQPVRSQNQLRTLLAARGIEVTQATLSRDLVELRAHRSTDPAGKILWKLPDPDAHPDGSEARVSQLERWCSEVLLSAQRVENQVVLRTPPGAANLLAAALDRAVLAGVVGCIAGDDTILVITASSEQGQALAEKLLKLAGQ